MREFERQFEPEVKESEGGSQELVQGERIMEEREESKVEVGLEQKEMELEEPLTPEKAVKLLFLSFRFSQGLDMLQEKIFEYLKTCHPTWSIDGGAKQAIYLKAEKHLLHI